MLILSPALCNFRTTTELVDALNVPVPALLLVVLAPSSCRRSECSLSVVLNNWGYCILCSQGWFPREFDPEDHPVANRRGYGLYSPQFQWKIKQHPTTCACSNALCESIGYSNHGMFCFPTDLKHVVEAARILGVSPATREKIHHFKIAPWHFDARHHYRDSLGNWKLRRIEVYKDSDRKSFPFTPPNASIANFIKEEGMHHGRRSDTLPGWVTVLARQQTAMTGGNVRPSGSKCCTSTGRKGNRRLHSIDRGRERPLAAVRCEATAEEVGRPARVLRARQVQMLRLQAPRVRQAHTLRRRHVSGRQRPGRERPSTTARGETTAERAERPGHVWRAR